MEKCVRVAQSDLADYFLKHYSFGVVQLVCMNPFFEFLEIDEPVVNNASLELAYNSYSDLIWR